MTVQNNIIKFLICKIYKPCLLQMKWLSTLENVGQKVTVRYLTIHWAWALKASGKHSSKTMKFYFKSTKMWGKVERALISYDKATCYKAIHWPNYSQFTHFQIILSTLDIETFTLFNLIFLTQIPTLFTKRVMFWSQKYVCFCHL